MGGKLIRQEPGGKIELAKSVRFDRVNLAERKRKLALKALLPHVLIGQVASGEELLARKKRHAVSFA